MGICLYISIAIISAGIFLWIIPILDNFSSVYPSIILIEGMKQAADPPLYSALLKTFQQYENIQKDQAFKETPLYDEQTSVIPDISDPNYLNLYLIKDEVNYQSPAAPMSSNIKVLERPIISFLKNTEDWKELWETTLDGVVYIMFKSKGGSDMGFVYKVLQSESQLHIIRYYPNFRAASYFDFPLPGSNKVSAISIKNDILVYSRVDGFYSYHALKIQKNGDELIIKELGTGEILNRISYELNEVTGVKLVQINSSDYLMVTKVVQAPKTRPRVILNVYSMQSSLINSTIYNISISEYVPQVYHNFNYLSHPKIKVSDENSVFAGHYGNILMYIRHVDSYFEAYYLAGGLSAEFNHIDISKSGEYAVIVMTKQTVPGYNERERLRLIKVNSSEQSVREIGFDIALDHLPDSLMERRIKAIKVVEWQDFMYVMVLYSNGALVLVDFNYELRNELEMDDSGYSVFWKIGILTGIGVLTCCVMFARRRRIHIR